MTAFSTARLLRTDEHVSRAVVDALTALGYDVETAQEAGATGFSDLAAVQSAAKANRAFLTWDRGDPREAHRIILQRGQRHAGVILISGKGLAPRVASVIDAALQAQAQRQYPPSLTNQLVRVIIPKSPKRATVPAKRRNPPTSDVRSTAEQNIVDSYRSKHWGIAPDVMIEVDDHTVGFPGVTHLAQMGALWSLELKPLTGELKVKRPLTLIDFSAEAVRPNVASRPHLAYDESKAQRLYLLLPPGLRAQAKKLIPKGATFYPLQEVADWVGGRQARFQYPAVAVYPLGIVDYISYLTEKRETPSTEGQGGRAQFRHEFGEETNGKKPILVVDRQGRMFLAGGSWVIKAGGIAN